MENKMNNIETKEEREFKIHPAILKSVILQQAGTLEKAFMELLMNAVDAGATRIDITLTNNNFEVKDNGKGFKDKKEIEDFFETFGTPHEKDDAFYGRFRMGRGQIMPFAKTTWRSSSYAMTTDIREKNNDKLGYILEENKEKIEGCIVSGEFYSHITQNTFVSSKDKLIYTIPKNVRFMTTPIFLNGTKINTELKDIQWDYETEEAYFKINEESLELHLYNKGVFVSTKNSYNYFGIGGIIVSKQSLNVNFARNDIISHECPIYSKIEEKLKEIVDLKRNRYKRLTYSEKKYYVDLFMYNEINLEEFSKYHIFQLLDGKTIKLTDFYIGNKNRTKIALANKKFMKEAEYCMKNNILTVFKKEILELFEVENLQQFLNKLKQCLENSISNNYSHSSKYIYKNLILALHSIEIIELSKYTNMAESDNTILKNSDLTQKERIILNIIKQKERAICSLAEKITKEHINLRKIFLGNSFIYDGWTDGSTFIVLNKNLLKNADFGITGFSKIFYVLLHEYLHIGFNSDQSHPHNLEFYENFHNALLQVEQNESIIEFSRAAAKNYFLLLEKAKLKVSKKLKQDTMWQETLFEKSYISHYLDYFKKLNSKIFRNINSIKEIEDLELFYLLHNINRQPLEQIKDIDNYYIKQYLFLKAKIEPILIKNIQFNEIINELSSFIDFVILNNKYLRLEKDLKKDKFNAKNIIKEFKDTYTEEQQPLLNYFIKRKNYFIEQKDILTKENTSKTTI
jgi:hypothetical protein